MDKWWIRLPEWWLKQNWKKPFKTQSDKVFRSFIYNGIYNPGLTALKIVTGKSKVTDLRLRELLGGASGEIHRHFIALF
jgi:hypothetical protein